MNWGWNEDNGWFTFDDFKRYSHRRYMFVDLDYLKPMNTPFDPPLNPIPLIPNPFIPNPFIPKI